jgi:uroporphyrinogen III methyltransferase / synthase
MAKTNGKVFLVGAGPGDPGLITVKGLTAIKTADVIVFDYLVGPTLIDNARLDAEIIYVGKKAGQHTMKQPDINDLLVKKGLEGNVVCRLKGGDPFVFGRGGEEAIALKEAGVLFEIVPGVTAATSVPAYAGIPVTHRGVTSTFAAITGHEDPTKDGSDIDWSKVATGLGTLIFFMGVRNLQLIAQNLIDHGRPADTPVALIRYGTLPAQRTLIGTLSDIGQKAKDAEFKPPALIVVGEVVKLRDQLNWYETLPLFGISAVVTRARAQASDLVGSLRTLGAQVVEFPTIRIDSPEDEAPLLEAAANLSSYDWVVFTSVNGVDAFFDALEEQGKDARGFAGVKVCAIGPATAERLHNGGILPDKMPEKYIAESLLEAFGDEPVKGLRFLLPRADIARSTLHDGLLEAGGEVTEVVAYQTVPEDRSAGKADAVINGEDPLLVTFTSSSTVKNFVNLLGQDDLAKISEKALFASIGPITSRTMRDLSIPVHVEAEEFTIPGLIAAVIEHYQSKESSR